MVSVISPLPLTSQEMIRLLYLRRLTPSQIQKEEGIAGELHDLEVRYLKEQEAQHQALIKKLLETTEVKAAFYYDYEAASVQVRKAIHSLPQSMTISTLQHHILLIQGWREYVEKFYLEATLHYNALSMLVNISVTDWQSRVNTVTEWQAKAQAQAQHSRFVLHREKAKRLFVDCKMIFERLTRQCDVLSRLATISDIQSRTGDVSVPNLTLWRKKTDDGTIEDRGEDNSPDGSTSYGGHEDR